MDNGQRLEKLNEIAHKIEAAQNDNDLFDAFVEKMSIIGGNADVCAKMDEIDRAFNKKFEEIGLAKLA